VWSAGFRIALRARRCALPPDIAAAHIPNIAACHGNRRFTMTAETVPPQKRSAGRAARLAFA
jgi:hypothetical protein